MKLLFLTLLDFDDISEHNIYTDLLREFRNKGHKVYIISPVERRKHIDTHYLQISEGVGILKLKIGNTQKANVMEKGISTITLEDKFVRGIKEYYANIKFDLILYSTPPITLYKAIRYVKRRDSAAAYLLLKDIFPQNAVDIGILNKNGIKGILYRYFRRKEEKLYGISDHIGCMSQANVDYIRKHDPELKPEKTRVCPNSVEPRDMSASSEEQKALREKYGIPKDKTVFVYGGNLGKPQGIDFLIRCLKSQANREDIFFLLIGSGTEYGKIERYIKVEKPNHVKLFKMLSREDYDKMVGGCDVGMIFLDYRFTIPNFPSRLLSYMQAKIPVLAVTDPNTDIGRIITAGEFGWWCESNNTDAFDKVVNEACAADRSIMGKRAWEYLLKNYTVERACQTILDSLSGKDLQIN